MPNDDDGSPSNGRSLDSQDMFASPITSPDNATPAKFPTDVDRLSIGLRYNGSMTPQRPSPGSRVVSPVAVRLGEGTAPNSPATPGGPKLPIATNAAGAFVRREKITVEKKAKTTPKESSAFSPVGGR